MEIAVNDFEFRLYSLASENPALKSEIQILKLFNEMPRLYSEIVKGNKYVVSECAKVATECFNERYEGTKIVLLATYFGIKHNFSSTKGIKFDLKIINNIDKLLHPKGNNSDKENESMLR